MSGNEINPEGAIAIAEAMEGKDHLEELDLNGNYFNFRSQWRLSFDLNVDPSLHSCRQTVIFLFFCSEPARRRRYWNPKEHNGGDEQARPPWQLQVMTVVVCDYLFVFRHNWYDVILFVKNSIYYANYFSVGHNLCMKEWTSFVFRFFFDIWCPATWYCKVVHSSIRWVFWRHFRLLCSISLVDMLLFVDSLDLENSAGTAGNHLDSARWNLTKFSNLKYGSPF